MLKSNYFILTGAMGGGKSTILAKLAESGVYCVPEPARAILAEQRLAEQRMTESSGVPEKQDEPFPMLMLARAIHNYNFPEKFCTTSFSKKMGQNFSGHLYQEKQPLSDSIIFDRGIPDMIAYANLSRLDATAYGNASKEFRYNPTVFYFAAWQEIYTNDEDRRISFEGAQAFGIEVKAIYENLGYRMLEVPRLSIEDRAKFILESVQEYRHMSETWR